MQILECFELNQTCYNMQQFLVIIKFILKILQWTVPIILIILGSIDMFKAMTSNDSKAVSESRNTFIRRLIMGICVFIVPFIVRLVFNVVDSNIKTGDNYEMNSWLTCWNEVDNLQSSYFKGCQDIYDDNINNNSNDNNDNNNVETLVNGICTYYKEGIRITTYVTKEICTEKNGEFSIE